MRLLLPSLLLFFYLLASLLWPLPYHPLIKAAAALVLLTLVLKYTLYEKIGGSFIAPDFPPWLLLILEVLYSAVVILAFLLVTKDCLALLLWLSRLFGSGLILPFTPGERSVGLVCSAMTLSLLGTWNAMKVPTVHTIEVILARLPAELDGFSIVQLSDLHMGILLNECPGG